MPVAETTAALRFPWLILLGLCLGNCVTTGFARFAYGLLLPAMKSELGWSYSQAGWLNTANAMGYVVGAVLTMVLIGRVGPSRLFGVGLVLTTFALLATGQNPALWWQSLWRILAGLFGALSFSTAGVLAAQLFPGDARRNALAIALLFGAGGGLGIVLAGAVLPLMLEARGAASWPLGWTLTGLVGLSFLPLALWSGYSLRPPRRSSSAPVQRSPLPLRRMLPELAGYAGFGLGYIVYMTFLSAWMKDQGASAPAIAAAWVLLGVCLCLSPFLWRPVFAHFRSGVPLAMILTCIALGSVLPLMVPGTAGQMASGVVFGLSVFMAPGAVTSFSRHNLPIESWGSAIALFTVVFAVAQTIGPYAAGLLGDLTGDIGTGLIAAAGVLLLGAGLALMQRPLAPAAGTAGD
jgi:MFS family permease